MQVKSCLILLALFFVIGCSNNSSTTQSPTKKANQASVEAAPVVLKKHNSESYTISYPQDWKLYTLSQYVELNSIIDEKSSMSFKRNFSVQISDRDITLDEMVEKYTKEITTFQKDAIIESSERKKHDGVDYQEIVFSSGKTNTKNINHYLVQKDKGFFLSFTTTIDDFDSYKEQALTVLNTLTVN